jgi:hypothetical protein
LKFLLFYNLLYRWLAFLNTYRTKCVTPHPEFRRTLDEVGRLVAA